MQLALCLLVLSLTLSISVPASAQGCAQCRDNIAATPPQTQSAYRRAITLIVVTAGSLFVGSVFLLRKHTD